MKRILCKLFGHNYRPKMFYGQPIPGGACLRCGKWFLMFDK